MFFQCLYLHQANYNLWPAFVFGNSLTWWSQNPFISSGRQLQPSVQGAKINVDIVLGVALVLWTPWFQLHLQIQIFFFLYSGVAPLVNKSRDISKKKLIMYDIPDFYIIYT